MTTPARCRFNAVVLPSPDVSVTIDLSRVRANAASVAAATGKPVLAVIKADAYGLGAVDVAEALADIASGFYVFRSSEVIDAELARFSGRHIIALHCGGTSVDELIRHRIHPVVWDARAATEWRAAQPVLSVDTGQGRFGCATSEIEKIIAAGNINEAMTHATATVHVDRFNAALENASTITFRHAAGSALIDQPAAWLDAVRPGLSLYDGAVRVTARLVEVQQSHGTSAGYTGFHAERYGIILGGYSNGLRRGPCAIDGRLTRILEVGMQSAFVELSHGECVGDEVELLGSACVATDVAAIWNASAQEVIFRLSRSGMRHVLGR